jgi:hypothetical protein
MPIGSCVSHSRGLGFVLDLMIQKLLISVARLRSSRSELGCGWIGVPN